MKKIAIILCSFLLIIISCKNNNKNIENIKNNNDSNIDNNNNITEDPKIADIFNKYNAEGTFVLYNINENNFIVYNLKRANERFFPASTFKIFNSLIGLETGAVKDVDEVFYEYNGEEVFLETWATNSNLRYAIKVSQLPAYKELARRIGIEKMDENIKKLEYGNMKIDDKIDSFWLDGPLLISAMEQVKLIAKLSKYELPYSIENQKAVCDIMIFDQTDNYILHAKTGLANSIGWFVGYVEENDNLYSFA